MTPETVASLLNQAPDLKTLVAIWTSFEVQKALGEAKPSDQAGLLRHYTLLRQRHGFPKRLP